MVDFCKVVELIVEFQIIKSLQGVKPFHSNILPVMFSLYKSVLINLS